MSYLSNVIQAGMEYYENGCFAQARRLYEQALAVTPDSAELHINLALSLEKDGLLEQALHHVHAAAQLKPCSALIQIGLAKLQIQNDQMTEAITTLQKAVTLDPQLIEAWHELGLLHRAQDNLVEAITCFQAVLNDNPHHLPALHALGDSLTRNGQGDQAISIYETLVAQTPEDPLVHFNLGFLRLLAGDYTQGWPEYAWRKQCHFPTVAYPHKLVGKAWTGQDLKEKHLFIYAEQGIGDILQYLRFIPLLKERGETISLEVRSPLVSLLETCPAIDRLLTFDDHVCFAPPYDFHVSIMDLPAIMGITLENMPQSNHCLNLPVEEKQAWANLLPQDRINIGIVWAGNPCHQNDAQRSCTLEHFEKLSTLPGIRLVSLQKGKAADQLQGFSGPIVNLAPKLEDFRDTATLIQHLDLVITVDTAVAHLAGTLGKPVWILLPLAPDWRWLTERTDSPWYPSAKLFRQSLRGDWPTVFNHVYQNLQERLNTRATAAQLHTSVTTALRQALMAYQAGQYHEAEQACQQALHHGQNVPQVHNTHGVILEALGRYDEAIRAQKHAIQLKPDYTEAWTNQAMTLQLMDKQEQAITACHEALKIEPHNAMAHFIVGSCHMAQTEYEAAITAFQVSLRFCPNQAETCNQLGMALAAVERYKEAIPLYKQAVTLEPDRAEFHNNLAIALKNLDQHDQACFHYQEAITLDPHSAVTHYNLANCLKEQGLCDQALQYYNQAIGLREDYADAYWNRSLCYLLQGNFSNGWQDYHWRHQADLDTTLYHHQYNKPAWDGRSFAGQRLLIHSEQGLGDTLQFIRYLPVVKALGGTVLIETWPEIIALCQRTQPADEWIPTCTEKTADNHYDIHASIMDLPGLLKTTFKTIPREIPYLQADPTQVQHWREQWTGPHLNVGLVWAGRPTHGNDRKRSINLQTLAPILNISGFRFIGLQKGEAAKQIKALPTALQFQNIAGQFTNLSDTAAAIEALDLVISVDTALAHLSGAMGKSVWTLLPFAPDWRWLLERIDSPWYPTMRLIRQTEPGHWDNVIQTVQTLLTQLARTIPKEEVHS